MWPEDEGTVQTFADNFVVLQATPGEVQILEIIGPAEQYERPVVGEVDAS